MCLAVPGQILELRGTDPLTRTAAVRFGAVVKEINVALTPEAQVGDHVLVHVGLAIAVLDADEAARVLSALAALSPLDALDELGAPNEPEAP
ncbi:MAG: HypC/HybG/HupF family hydrogenase formation chaperone [Polyangia bacterium]